MLSDDPPSGLDSIDPQLFFRDLTFPGARHFATLVSPRPPNVIRGLTASNSPDSERCTCMSVGEWKLWTPPGEPRLTSKWLRNHERWHEDVTEHLQDLMIQHGCWTTHEAEVGQPDSPFGRLLAHFRTLFPTDPWAADASLHQMLINRLRYKIDRHRKKMRKDGVLHETLHGDYVMGTSLMVPGSTAGRAADPREVAALAWLQECSLPALVRVVQVIGNRVGPAALMGLLSVAWAPMAPLGARGAGAGVDHPSGPG